MPRRVPVAPIVPMETDRSASRRARRESGCSLPACSFPGLIAVGAERPSITTARSGRSWRRTASPATGPTRRSGPRGCGWTAREAAIKPLKSGETAIVPGDPDVQRADRPDHRGGRDAPHAAEEGGQSRSAPAEVDVLTRWVQQGAEYAEHWALIPPRGRAAAQGEGRGLAPQRHRLLDPGPPGEGRAAALARGRPLHAPAPGRASTCAACRRRPRRSSAFVSDTAPGRLRAGRRRFLDDPAYGERWARMWLDLARYADSAGYGSDPLRHASGATATGSSTPSTATCPTTGSPSSRSPATCCPTPTLEQRIATAFHRNTMTNTEGGTDDEEFRVAADQGPRRHHDAGLDGPDDGLRQVPHPQVRPDHAGRILPVLRDLQPDRRQRPARRVAGDPVADRGDHRAGPEDRRPDRRAEGQLEAADPALATAQVMWEASLADPDAAARKDVPKEILAILDTPAASGPRSRPIAGQHFRSIAPELKPIRDEIARLEKSRPEIPTLPVMVELPDGQAARHAAAPQGQLPRPRRPGRARRARALHPLPAGRAARPARRWRSGWSIPKNPLTARVAVNRFWAQLFGVGIVETEEDFGTQGELPSHPELLDWLAVRVHGLGLGHQGAAQADRHLGDLPAVVAGRRPSCWRSDPRNRLLARAPRVRLEAEMVRDQALALSGLLSRKIGGPSVFPPQPDGPLAGGVQRPAHLGHQPGRGQVPPRRSTPSGGGPCPIPRWRRSTPPAARSARSSGCGPTPRSRRS